MYRVFIYVPAIDRGKVEDMMRFVSNVDECEISSKIFISGWVSDSKLSEFQAYIPSVSRVVYRKALDIGYTYSHVTKQLQGYCIKFLPVLACSNFPPKKRMQLVKCVCTYLELYELTAESKMLVNHFTDQVLKYRSMTVLMGCDNSYGSREIVRDNIRFVATSGIKRFLLSERSNMTFYKFKTDETLIDSLGVLFASVPYIVMDNSTSLTYVYEGGSADVAMDTHFPSSLMSGTFKEFTSSNESILSSIFSLVTEESQLLETWLKYV